MPAGMACGAWIEQGFKITKRAGWQWHRTRMSAPDRAARLWLAVAVATLWLLSVGGEADETILASTLLDVTGWCPERPRACGATRLRLVSVFRQGWVRLLVALLRQEPLPQGRWVRTPGPPCHRWWNTRMRLRLSCRRPPEARGEHSCRNWSQNVGILNAL